MRSNISRANACAPSRAAQAGPEHDRVGAARSPSAPARPPRRVSAPSLGGRPTVIASSSRTANVELERGRARRRSRSPRRTRIAASAAIVGAPVSPVEPPITNTLPELNLVESGAAARHVVEHAVADQADRRARRARRAGCRCRSPRRRRRAPCRAGSTAPAWRGGTSRWRRRGPPAPATSPVEASTPDGTSAATTGAAAALIASITPAAGSRGAPVEPVPSSASTIACAPVEPLRPRTAGRVAGQPLELLGARRPAASPAATRPARRPRARPARSSRAATSPSPPLLPLPQTIAIRPGRRALGDHAGEPLPRALHQLQRRDALALLDRPASVGAHLLRRRAAAPASAAGSLEHRHGRRHAVRVGERHRHGRARARPRARPPRRSAAPRAARRRRRAPRRRASSTRAAASALATASLAQKRAARCIAGRARVAA